MAEPIDIYIGEDKIVMLDLLKNPETDAYDNAMTGLTFELRDSGGVLLTSGSLSYVAASNGRYTGTIADTIGLAEGETYWLWIKQTNGNVHRRVECVAKYHGET